MERKYKILVWLVLVLLPAFFYIQRDGFVGLDSYYYYSGICNPGDHHYHGDIHPAANVLFSFTPCNEILLKGLLILFYATSLFFIWKIGELYDKNIGWMAMLFAGLTPIFLNTSLRLENDPFAFPIAFAGLYFFLKFLSVDKSAWLGIRKRYFFFVASIILILGAASFWGGSLYYLFGFSVLTHIGALATIIVTLFFGPQLLEATIPISTVGETFPLFGIVFVFFYYLLWKTYNHPFNRFSWFMIILAIVNVKFFILAVPILALTLVKSFGLYKKETQKKILLIVVLANLAYPLMLLPSFVNEGARPTPIELNAVQETIQYANEHDLNVVNDWDLGHIVFFYGGFTKQHGSFSPPPSNQLGENRAVLTQWDSNCTLVKTFEKQKGIINLESNLALYHC